MKNKNMLLLMGLALIAVVIFSALSFQQTEPGASDSFAKRMQSEDEVPVAIRQPASAPSSGLIQTAQQPDNTEAMPAAFMTEAIQSQMADVAHAFEENMRYPSYSKPLKSSDWNLLNPRPFVSKAVPLDSAEGLTGRIWLAHYIVHAEQDLPVELYLDDTQGTAGKARNARVYLSDGHSVSAPVPLLALTGNNKSVSAQGSASRASERAFTGIIPSSLLAAALDSKNSRQQEMQLLAKIEVGQDNQATVSAIIKLVRTDALLTALEPSYVDAEHMVIPAQFEVYVPGYYRVQANLFDQQSGAPISHINTAFMLSEQNNRGLLKVHAITLRAMGFPGPYVIKDFNLSRGPAHPGDQSGYGLVVQEYFPVAGHDLSIYDETEYIDPAAQQRLEFLQRMAGTP